MTGHHDEEVEAFAAEVEAIFRRHRHQEDLLPPFETLIVFAADVQLNCRLYLRDKDGYRRPIRVAEDMEALAEHLREAALLAEKLEAYGMQLIHAASHRQSPAEDVDPAAIPVGLARLARDVTAAGALAHDLVRSGSRHREGPADRGGPTPDEPLRRLVRRLAVSFQHYLRIKPGYTSRPEDGTASSLFDEVVRYGFRRFTPVDVPLRDGVITMETRGFLAVDDDTAFYGLPAGDRDMDD